MAATVAGATTPGGATAPVLRARDRDPLHFRTLWRSRMLRPERPDRLIRTLGVLHRWGLTPAAAYGVGAIRYPERRAIVDERGALTFVEAQRRTNALANALGAAGIGEQDTVVIMCRNHRGFIEATIACSKLGANVLYLDTGLAASRIADLLRRADPLALIYDEEFSALMPQAQGCCRHFIAWCDAHEQPPHPLLEQLIAGGDTTEPTPPRERRGVAMLTVGSSGSPEHVERQVPNSLVLPPVLLSPIPLRRGQTTVVGAPLCHPWGFVHLKLGLRLGSTLVLRRRFDPQATLREVARHQATALAVVPEMLQRIIGLGKDAIADCQTSALRVIAVNGWSLPQELAMPALATFGDLLYNLHGPSVVKLNGHWVSVDHECRSPRATSAYRAHIGRRVTLANHARRSH
jgi:acyl-CoA synthetase (AMP-forming)/AMP-acid ligase II